MRVPLAVGAILLFSIQAHAQTATRPDDTLQEVVVTGSRIGRAAGFDSPTPLTVFDANILHATAQPSVADALNKFPSFAPSTTGQTATFGVGTAGQTALDLRGLGANRTLVLVDGRRFVSSTTTGTFDANLLPSSLVKRVEVVTGGASAVYGSDAVAGVVNFILDDNLEGIHANVQYGSTFESDGEDSKISLSGGANLFGGRGHFIGAVDYEKQNAVDSCFSRTWCSPNGLADSYQIVNPGGPGANGLPNFLNNYYLVTSMMTRNGLVNNTALRGTQFNSDGSVSPTKFSYGAITTNIYTTAQDSSGNFVPNQEDAFHLQTPIQQAFERYTGYARLTFDFTDDIRGFLEGTYGSAVGHNPIVAYRSSGSTISLANPYLPAALRSQMTSLGLASISVGKFFEQPSADGTVSRDTVRIASGLNGTFTGSWKWDTYYQYGTSSVNYRLPNNPVPSLITLAVDAVVNPATGQTVCRSTLTNPTNGCAPINPFGTGTISAAGIAYGFRLGSSDQRYDEHVVAANAHGDLMDLWGGPLALAAGAEYRDDRVNGKSDPLSTANLFTSGNITPINGSIKVTEAYLEIDAPLLKDKPLAKSLTLNGAVRETHYSTSGSVTTWKAGLVWEPVSFMRLRATQSHDIRAPNMVEYYGARQVATNSILDPKTNLQYNVLGYSGGNQRLEPESADTWTAGLVLQPDSKLLGGTVRFSADYFSIAIDKAIATLGSQNIVNLCNQGLQDYCSLVSRNSSNVIVSVDNYVLNLNALTTKGIDFEADYAIPLSNQFNFRDGALRLRALATRVFEMQSEYTVGASVDVAGQNGWPSSAGQPGIPDWKVFFSADYSVGPMSIGANVRFITSGTYNATLIGPGQPGYSVTLPNSIDDNSLPSQTLLDLSARYTFDLSSQGALQLYGAVVNVTDQHPPIAPSPVNSFNPQLYDPVGRTYRIGFRYDLN